MRNARVVVATVVAAAVAGFVFSATSRNVQGQAGPQQAPRSIDSLAEPGQSLQVTDVSQESGFVTFAASRGTGLLLPVEADAPAEERALAFLDAYGGPFGLRGRGQAQLLREPTRDELGLEHVRLQQMHQGLPVRGGELIVHLRGNRAMAANGMVFDRLPADVRPQYPAGAAEIEARAVVERAREDLSLGMRLSAPRLEIFSGRLFGKGDLPARTAWFFEAVGPTLREFIWVDAATGGVLLNFSQLAHAKNRTTYNGNNTAALPGTLARSEGQGPTGNAEVDSAHDLAGVTYDYFFSTHGRDSYDGLGGALISTVNHCPTSAACPYANAFWSGTQMVYGAGYARSDDVVAHELTHAVTEKSAGLLYYYQSGALNESFSDIFGETVDLLSATGGGNDTAGVRWQMGEDLPIGAIRNMMNPTLFWDPGKMSDPQFYCVTNAWANQSLDYGGVHHNSGVPNHAYALMVDGGTYNGMTVTGIGLDKAAKIQYRTLTTYLTSGARFVDNLNGVLQSCFDLIGLHGITAADCGEVLEAMLAVQMDFTWNCPGAVAAPAMCSAGQPSPVFSDHLESGFGNWAISSSSAVNWGPSSFFASSGTTSMYGPDASSTSIHNVQKTTPVVVPANAFLYFKHAFEFDHVGNLSYDGGVMEFSTNAGSSWISAQPLINAGQNYTDGLELGTPLPSGTQAFTRSSFGYTATRLNLASLAGMSLTFRFRVATNATVGSLGWLIDDVSIYTCGAGVGPVITSNPVNQTIAPGGDATFTVAATGIPGPEYTWYVSANGGVTWAPVNDAPPYSGARTPTLRIDDAPVGLNGRRYKALVRNNHGEQETTSALLTVGATYTLSISKAGAGTGTVTSSPAGINCGSSCSASFNSGQVVMLTATPSAGSLFAGWSGDADCSDGSVTMSAARSCTATFQLTQAGTFFTDDMESGTGTWSAQFPWAVTTEFAHSGTHAWSDSPGGPYGSNVNTSLVTSSIDLSAASAPRLRFWQRRDFAGGDGGNVWISLDNGATHTNLGGYSGADATWTESTIDLSAYAGASAARLYFQVVSNDSLFGDGWFIDDVVVREERTLSVSLAGTGAGTVTSNPAGINCGTECSASFSAGQVVTLTATPSAGSIFAGWSGDADCNDGSVTMSAARSCTATFTGQTYLLSVSKAGTGTGTVTSSPGGINCGSSCSASFNTGQVVTLTATPLAGSRFVSWTGDVDCSDGTVTMTGPRSCTATFTAQTPVTVTPASLSFAALKAGAAGPVTNVTPPQTVTVSFPGLPDVWSASSPQAWLQVTNGSGNGDGQFTVAIVNPGNVIGGNTTLGGVVSVVIASDPTVSVSVPVTLTVDQTGASTTQAFGQVDTPAQNAPNQVGAIGVTGWALDDVAVMSVKIYRTCVAFDNPASCQIVLGQNVVFVGDAAFLAGARPDVEAAFPAYPFNYRAGWGMQILTNMLPNLPAAQLYGGQGTIALYAVATDVEGHSTLLGRTSADSTPTTITLNNNGIAKPFGTADTPQLGATVSGTLPAFLWALTPDTDTVAGNGDIQINPTGTTMVLFVDGVATAPVAFNQCRGTVGNPPPSGVYCNDDVANVFGNATPQAPLTPRMSNPTRFRNLDAGRGAIGVNVINTTLLANGLHTVAWSVTDSAGRVEGIGSRFFTVLNGGGSIAERIVTLVDVLTAPAVARGQAASLDGVRVSRRPVSVRTGYDLQTPMTALAADGDGVRHVTLAPLGRLEIGLANAATGGYLEANGELRDLPPGSHLDRATGVFTWMPPAMYIGTYRLVFLIDGERVVVSVRLGER